MLTDRQIKKLIDAQKKIFPTKEDFDRLFNDIHNAIIALRNQLISK